MDFSQSHFALNSADNGNSASTSIIIKSILNNPALRTPEPDLVAGSVGVIVAIIVASILFVLFFILLAYCLPFTRCYLACSICANLPCFNCIFWYYTCCSCLDGYAMRRFKMKSSEKPIYIQDMLATPDGKIIHMSKVGRVVTP